MPKTLEMVVTPEVVVLEDGRRGYFIAGPTTKGAIVVVKYPSLHGRIKKQSGVVRSKGGKPSSVVTALNEVKSRKSVNNYPTKDFDSLMDEL